MKMKDTDKKRKMANKENEKGRRPDYSNKADNIAVWISKTKTGNDYLYVKIGDDVFRAWKND